MIDVIPNGTSAVVSTGYNDRGNRGGWNNDDFYSMSERVKDAISRSDLASCERTHGVSDEVHDLNTAEAQRHSDLMKSVYDVVGGSQVTTAKAITDAQVALAKAITDTSTALDKEVDDVAVGITKAVTDASFASSLAFADTKNSLIGGFKDARFDSCNSTAAIQSSLCAGFKDVQTALALAARENVVLFKEADLRAAMQSKETALLIKDSELLAYRNKAELSAQMAECCCALKQEIGSVKGDMKQQEIDRLREQLTDAKNRSYRRSFHPMTAGSLVADDE